MASKILLVEDDPQSLGLMASALSKNGYDVFTAKDTQEAHQIWSDPAHTINLLISDVQLYEEDDGFVLARKLLEEKPNIPVIFVSGDRDCFASPAIQRFGDAPFIAKPFHLKDMLKTVSDVLAKS